MNWKFWKHGKKPDEFAMLIEQASKLLADNEQLRNNNTALLAKQSNDVLTIQSLHADLADKNSRLREQTEADLLLASARIIATIMRGKKPEVAYIQLQNQLLAQQGGFPRVNVPSGLEATFGALGIYGR